MKAHPGQRFIFAACAFLSAFLLLVLQPVFTKAILPWFGGSAGVWTGSMLFYQLLLLLGYLYAHLLTLRLRLRTQVLLHLSLLAVSMLLLPLHPNGSWKPTGAEDPLARVLALLSTSVGLPYFLLSATSPLLQAWYARLDLGPTPYRLFAVSNLGSFLALLSYPFVVEPLLSVHTQLSLWAVGYAFFGVLIAIAAIPLVPSSLPATPGSLRIPSGAWLWVAFASVPSILWLAVANHLSQDVAAVPFLWIVPLALYLLSFVVCFGRVSWYRPKLFRWILPLAVVGLLFGIGLQQYLPFRAYLALYALELLSALQLPRA